MAKTPCVRLTLGLVESRTRSVVWFGIGAGGALPPNDPGGLTSTVEMVARTLL